MSPGLRRLAVLAAAILHLAVFLWLLHPWRSALEQVPPPAVPVTLVFEPPPKPTPRPAAKAPPQPQAQPQPAPEPVYRQSGPDAKTTAPPPPSEPDEPKDAARPPDPPPMPALPVPAAPPKPEPPHPAAKPKEEKPPRPPVVSRTEQRAPARMKNAAPGERRTTGDPYFNAALAELEKHRFYPALARPLGLAGTAAFSLLVDRSGKILDLRLDASSGSDLLDRAAEKMIRDTERFPPLPADIPGSPVTFWVEIPMAPR